MTTLRIRCEGLEPGKLVAFLALLGALRSLRVGRPNWRVRAWWSGEDPRPELEVAGADGVEDVGIAMLDGIRAHRVALDFGGRKDPTYEPAEVRALLAEAASSHELGEAALRLDAVSALASDAIVDPEKGLVRPTPYCLMFGQGHQHFLKNLSLVPAVMDGLPARLVAALQETWPYAEQGLTFRWDVEEDRRYALRAANPSGDKVQTSDAGNRLAAIGMLSLTCLPAERYVTAPGFTRTGRRAEFRWPIWGVPMGERGVLSLLRHPFILQGTGTRPCGVRRVMAAERTSVGKFLVVTQGKVVA